MRRREVQVLKSRLTPNLPILILILSNRRKILAPPPSNSPNHLPKVRNDVRSTLLATVMRVETRAMTEQSEERKPLKCPAVSQLDIGKRDVINAQNTCPTLKSIREKVKTGKIDNVKNRAVKYEIINGLIYRICLEVNSIMKRVESN
ncbi:uncharacterized protein LOC119581014 [Penaeus monodon]|uniref:uncharacterized protein LOC119581014 n=1 Tax=Penaeus monodon TaxID=6687 RepID=UPI0018A7367B|nr:uncharacterized protein LOC119581014 [Penaeus monodon]